MIALRSALPTPKEAWKNMSRFIRVNRRFGYQYLIEALKAYEECMEHYYNIDRDLFFLDYISPCLHIYYYGI